MGCRGCTNLQCSCFTTGSDSTVTVGNGTQYAPFTFRPDYTPFPRPFGSMYGLTDQVLDGAPYSLFPANTPDIDHGGNMRTGNGTNLTATADGIYLVGIVVPFIAQAVADLNDAVSIRRNSVQVSTVTFAHTTALGGEMVLISTTTLLDLNTGDLLDLFVERVGGAGSITVKYILGDDNPAWAAPRLWAVWMGGMI